MRQDGQQTKMSHCCLSPQESLTAYIRIYLGHVLIQNVELQFSLQISHKRRDQQSPKAKISPLLVKLQHTYHRTTMLIVIATNWTQVVVGSECVVGLTNHEGG